MAAMLELCITEYLLKLNFPVCKVPVSIPLIVHDVLSFVILIQSDSLPFLVSQSRMGGDLRIRRGLVRNTLFPQDQCPRPLISAPDR